LDVVQGYVGRGEHTQPLPGFHSVQEFLDSIDVIFCHARTIDNIVGMVRECLALVLELLKLDGGNELESLAERGGASAAKRETGEDTGREEK